MEILIDTSGFSDQLTEDYYNVFLVMQDEFNFDVERILLDEDIDGWEHTRAIKIFNFHDEDDFYFICNMCNQLNLSYEDL